MRRRVALLLAVMATTGAGGTDMDEQQRQLVFSAIDRLIAARGATPAEIEALVQTKLQRDAARSTTFFSIYDADLPPDRPFSHIELRASTNSRIAAGMIILTRPAEDCLPSDAVIARYGQDFALSPPRAGTPPGSPTYYVYRRDWGALRLGVTPGRPGCLVSVVIDWPG
jgi:hypothetical protein